MDIVCGCVKMFFGSFCFFLWCFVRIVVNLMFMVCVLLVYFNWYGELMFWEKLFDDLIRLYVFGVVVMLM